MRFFCLILVVFFSSCVVIKDGKIVSCISTPKGAAEIRDADTRSETARSTVDLSHHALEHGQVPAYNVSESGVSYGPPGGGYGEFYSAGNAFQNDLVVIEAANEAAWEAGVEETLRRQDEEIKRNGRKVDKTTKGMLKHIRGQ